ncbi:GNAT family N-acetyltransferase [Halorussus amylolyticus]|uniref:GNAT family N-acetyltransferase n=1 Tax=Halorussus amylolyticus TaxID=1126242 RepID=UPI001EE4D10E|nr:GNAT family N-acetyltransferase [Halorussus amylolyticus]
MAPSEADSDGIEIREASPDDVDGIRTVAASSLHASYDDILGADAIDRAVSEWYGDDAVEAELETDGMLYLVAEAGGEIVGFSQSTVAPEDPVSTVLWLHIDPDSRDTGIGSTLLERTQAELADRGVERVTAEVLADNEAGNTFYETHGFEKATDRDTQIGDSTYTENVYVQAGTEKFEVRELGDKTLYVDWTESGRGSKAPFYAAYSDESEEDLYGWYCSNCGSFDTAMDSMERLECNNCGNRKKPVRWDAAYL